MTLFLYVLWSLATEVGRLRIGQGPLTSYSAEVYLSIPMRVLTGLAVLIVGFGLMDYAFLWVCHLRQLRMTRAELTAELRELEGDPINRRRVRQKRINSSYAKSDRMLRRGDLLLLGNGRLALGIRFSDQTQATVLVKVVGSVADSMERLAQVRGVTVVRHGVLARRVVDQVQVGQNLPTELMDQMDQITKMNSRPATANHAIIA